MIDVSKYEKIGEYREGKMTWISPINENIVYLISFGDESYIGSTVNIRNRFQSFISKLRRGKCASKRASKNVQSAFDGNCGFDLYAIEFASSNTIRGKEEYYINTMRPSLNIRKRADYLYRDSLPLSSRHREKVKMFKRMANSAC